MTFFQRVAFFQSDLIREALQKCGSNRKAAVYLGIGRNTLLRYRHSLGFPVSKPNYKKSIVRRNGAI